MKSNSCIMTQQDLLEAYLSIYATSLDEETIRARGTDKASREAAAKRLAALKRDPQHNDYVKPKEKPTTTFGRYADAWNKDPRADAEFEKMNKPAPEYHPKTTKDLIASRPKGGYTRTTNTDSTPAPKETYTKHTGKFGKYVDAAVRAITKEDVKQLLDYMVNEGFANSEVSAEVMVEHMNPEWADHILNEMRKQDKVAGKKSGGDTNPAYREIKKVIRGMEGTPKGQQKKVPGKKPPRAGEYGSERQSPKTTVEWNRIRRQEGERNMSSRFD